MATTEPLFADAFSEYPRFLSISKKLVVLTVACSCAATQLFAKQSEELGLNVCVAVARVALDVITSDPKTLTKRCECVSQKRNGKLPDSMNAWKKTDKNNPGLALVDCSRTDIVNFYQNATFKAPSARMKEQGFQETEIVRFTSCAGEGAFSEMRRVSASLLTSKLDKARFSDMYRRCEPPQK